MNIPRIIEFIGNHYLLFGVFLALLAVLAFTEIRRGGRSLSSSQLTDLINQNLAVVVDVRAHKDFNAGHITSSINIPLEKFATRSTELDKYKEEKLIVLIDALGQQTGSSAQELIKKGFTVAKLNGGISGWQSDSLPLVKA